MRNALIALFLVLAFGLAGAGLYKLLAARGMTPTPAMTSQQLAGSWRGDRLELRLEADGANLRVFGLDQGSLTFVSSGKGWAESSPQSQVPRVLEWNGQALELRIFDDTGLSRVVVLQRKT